MKNILIGVVVLVVLVCGWFLLFNYSNDYTVVVQDEVSILESELAAIDEALQKGILTPAEAVIAQTNIVKRLNTINETVSNNAKATLTDSQKVQLQAGLENLKNILLKYQSTLLAVDETAEDASENEKQNSGSNADSVSETVTEVVESVEEHVEDVVESYEQDDEEFTIEDTASSTNEMSDTEEGTDEMIETDEEADANSAEATTTDNVVTEGV